MSENDGFTYREHLGPEAEGEAVLAYLCRRYDHTSSFDWRVRIERGDVRIDAVAAGPNDRLRRGQRLEWRRPPWNEPDAPLRFDRLYEDDDVLAVGKPAGLPTLPGANFLQSTLLHQVGLESKGATPVHRLGRFTSGVVLFAKTAEARAELSRQLRAREIDKRYRALASGDPPWDAITVDRPIGPALHARLGTVYAAVPSGKPSSSRVEVLVRRRSSFLCDVWIATGRPHQVRIHLASVGHPLVGDPLYVAGGVPAADTHALPGDPGYRLHAVEVAFRHPRTGRRVVVTAPSPDPMLDGREPAHA
jgi:23S rRNA pseudouridine1911/1915/1917 synthase